MLTYHYTIKGRFIWLILSLLFSFFGLLSPIEASNRLVIEGEKYCDSNKLQTSFELSQFWIHICSKQGQLFLVRVNKSDNVSSTQIPVYRAKGRLPVYATLYGIVHSIISDYKPRGEFISYEINPQELKVFQRGNLVESYPVLQTIDDTGAILFVLEGNIEKQAKEICQQDIPSRVYQTANAWIYLCLKEDNNQISYIEINKLDPTQILRLPAKAIIPNLLYQAINNQAEIKQVYRISADGLEVWEKNRQVSSQLVTHVYLKI